ncbi:hypothetical protein PUNSTDRAFT_92147 [Punctularia strigosozonata HHB-11173 SS5]|uniref:Membrane insertase YidC/Oxa/ALB C-terminal domain-containing protein n=1 Tax=Punctularia strigosozonata (strain HHB-11173) TaxID=741275 RepID=R7S5Y5_PUNST|nr:uncharacterized protein PUNSTDRAFT_92147 [Punctularia strigosozonata HHB-11173 SS5]EIN05276.1 hypothetical protein PUNSTDRAFT_92147 [Punctularia strigosozonata HHB-11173 SS5]
MSTNMLVSRTTLLNQARLCGGRTSGVIRLPSLGSKTVPISRACSGLLHPRSAVLAAPGLARSYWWSTKSPEASTAAASPPSPPAAPTAAASEATTSVTEAAKPSSADLVQSVESVESVGDVVPESASAVADAAASVSTAPLHYGDLAQLGLTGWGPSGLSVSFLEALHVFTQLPWAWTIVLGTVATRLIVLPFTIRSMRASAALAPYQPRFQEIMKQFAEARAQQDLPRLQKLAMEQKLLYREAGFSMGSAITGPLVQIPVTFGMFMGLRRMCEHPVEQLKNSGWDFFPDLTVADPTYVLPFISTVLIPLTMKVSMRDMSSTAAMNPAHIYNGMLVLSPLMFVVLTKLAAGVSIYTATGALFAVLQSAALRSHAVRRALKIPIVPPTAQPKPVSIADTWRALKDNITQRAEQSQRTEMARQPRPRDRNGLRR